MIAGAPLIDDRSYTIVGAEFPAAALAHPPFKGSGTSKLYDTREMRAILTDRLRRDLVGSPATGQDSAPSESGLSRTGSSSTSD